MGPLITISNYAMMYAPKVMEWGGSVLSSIPFVMDCTRSAQNGLAQKEDAASPSKGCYIAGELTSEIFGITDASADDIQSPSVAKKASDGPQVPIAH